MIAENKKSIIVIVVSIIILFASIAIIPRVFDSSEKPNNNPETSFTSANEQPFDKERRNYSRQTLDDSRYTPGYYDSDKYNHSVYIPINSGGDPFTNYYGETSGDIFVGSKPIEIIQQYIHGRYIAVSDEAGPRNFDTAVPTEYTKDYRGAIVAASNFMTAAYYFRDPYAIEYFKTHSQGQITDDIVAQGATSDDLDKMPPPAFMYGKILYTQDKNNRIVLDLANRIDLLEPSVATKPKGYGVMRITMVYNDASKNWIVQTAKHNQPISRESKSSEPNIGWIKVNFLRKFNSATTTTVTVDKD